MTGVSIAVKSLSVGLPAFSFVPGRLGISAKSIAVGRPSFSLVSNYVVGSTVTRKRLNRLSMLDQITDIKSGKATVKFQRDYQANVEQTEASINALFSSVTTLQQIVDRLVAAEQSAGEAVIKADAVTLTVAAQTTLQRVRDSSTDAGIVTAENIAGSVTITIAANTRYYLAPLSPVPVNGGTIASVPAATTVFIYYDDPNLTGGAVTYYYTEDPAQSVATDAYPYRHSLGSIATPVSAGGGSVGEPTTPPWNNNAAIP